MLATASGDIPPAALDRLLVPRSVAIVGASPTPGALGNSVMRNLDRAGFAGEMHLVNPKRDAIDERPCVAAIADLPDGIDVAVLAIPGAAVPDALRALASKGTGAVIVFAAGFAEGGADGRAAQADLARLSAESGMVVLGPNCLGLANFHAGIPLTFVEIPPVATRNGAQVALISQSGAMAIVQATTLMARQIGLSAFVSTGNEAAIGVEDVLGYMLTEDRAQVFAMIVEQFRDPARFLHLAGRAREAGKRIVLLHPGRSEAARESAATHTGAMAGDWQMMRTKIGDAGVVLTENLEEFGDVVELAVRVPTPPAGGCGVLTESGAFKAMVLDLADAIGLDLPALLPPAAEAMRAALPDFIPVSNPMDLTAQALVDPGLYGRALAAMLKDERLASVVFALIQTDDATVQRKFPSVIEAVAAQTPDKPVIVCGIDEGATFDPAPVERLRALGVPYFPTPDRALRALRVYAAAMPLPERSALAPIRLPIPESGGTVCEYRAKALLADAGIAVPQGGLARDVDEAVRVANDIGYPVALKVQAAAIAHKSDAGGVVLGISDEYALHTAFAAMLDSFAGQEIDGILVEKMGPRGVEIIVGARRDPDWGAALLVGLGGVQAELYKDVRLIAPDLFRDGIRRELLELRGAALLTGFRGSASVDLDALCALIERIGAVVRGTPEIVEIDLNPVVAYPDGRGCLVLDALIETVRSGDRTP